MQYLYKKAFLLNEEFQKEKPRSKRMSRHIYDLEKLMDKTMAKPPWKTLPYTRPLWIPRESICPTKNGVKKSRKSNLSKLSLRNKSMSSNGGRRR